MDREKLTSEIDSLRNDNTNLLLTNRLLELEVVTERLAKQELELQIVVEETKAQEEQVNETLKRYEQVKSKSRMEFDRLELETNAVEQSLDKYRRITNWTKN